MVGDIIIIALSPSPPDARTRGDGTAAYHVGIGLAWFSFSDGTSIRNTAARLPPNARGGVLLGRLTPSGRCVYLADERGLHRAHGASRAASRLLADRKRRTRTTSTGAHYHRALTSTRKDSHVSPAGDSRLREDLLEDYYEMCSLLIGAQEQRVLPPDRLVSGHRSIHPSCVWHSSTRVPLVFVRAVRRGNLRRTPARPALDDTSAPTTITITTITAVATTSIATVTRRRRRVHRRPPPSPSARRGRGTGSSAPPPRCLLVDTALTSRSILSRRTSAASCALS